MNYTIISFPNLGSGLWQIEINRTALSIGPLHIQWYAIILTIGIIAAFFYFTYRAKKSGFTSDDCLDYTIFTVIFAIVGSRLLYVLTNLEYYHSFLEAIAIWNGGLAIYGSIIFGAITMLIVSKVKKKNPLTALDCVAPAVMLGQIIGRWGNFVNGEAYGSVVEYHFLGASFRTDFAKNFPWLMSVSHKTVDSAGAVSVSDAYIVQPTFLYESLWNLIGFLIINSFFKKKKYEGQILLLYLGWYGFGRMIIEGMRTDSLMVGPLRFSQLFGLICFVVSATLLIFFKIRGVKAKNESAPEAVAIIGAEEDAPSLSEVGKEIELPDEDGSDNKEKEEETEIDETDEKETEEKQDGTDN